MKAKSLYIISLITALFPMTVGSIIFWTWFFYPKLNYLESLGIQLTMISIPICIVGIILAIIAIRKNEGDKKVYKKIIKAELLAYANIPLALFYILFAIYILDTERITIVNNSNYDIENISIFGTGDNVLIEKIEKKDSRTVWIKLEKEGSIKMRYNINEQVDSVYLISYTGPGMGGTKINYYINSLNINN